MLNEEQDEIVDTCHQCEKCPEKFGSEKSLKNHVRIFHVKPKTKKNLFNSKFRGEVNTTDDIILNSSPILNSPMKNSTENMDRDALKVEIMNTASALNTPPENISPMKNSEITQKNSTGLKTSPILEDSPTENSKENMNIMNDPSPLNVPTMITAIKNSEMTQKNSTVEPKSEVKMEKIICNLCFKFLNGKHELNLYQKYL